MTNKRKLSNDEAADFLGVKGNTLEVWRCKHKGPRYSKIGSRVLYDIDDLEEFFTARAVETMESAPKISRFRSGK